MSSCLEAAGVPHWVFGAEMINIDPLTEIVYDGYKLVTNEEDLPAALAILTEAKANPASCEERLDVRLFPWTFAIFHLSQLMWIGLLLWLPMRRYSWVSRP